MKKRLFVAIALPEETRRSYQDQAKKLAESLPDARWTRPENLHITIGFLGDVEEGDLSGLMTGLAHAADSVGPFILSPAGIKLIPPGRRPPTMVWAVMRESGDYLRLHGALRREARPFAPDMPAEKEVVPHVTLARFVRGARPPREVRQEQLPRPFSVDAFSLVESHLEPSGPRYQELKKFNFKSA